MCTRFASCAVNNVAQFCHQCQYVAMPLSITLVIGNNHHLSKYTNYTSGQIVNGNCFWINFINYHQVYKLYLERPCCTVVCSLSTFIAIYTAIYWSRLVLRESNRNIECARRYLNSCQTKRAILCDKDGRTSPSNFMIIP